MLDNFEQVVAAAPVVADLLRAAPDIKVVVTSRAVLHVSGEQEYPVPGLPTPPDPSAMSGLERLNAPGGQAPSTRSRSRQYGAVRLFVERAVAVRPDFVGDDRERAGGRGHQRPAPGHAARHRARRGPGQDPARPTRSSPGSTSQLDVLAAGSRDLPARQQTLRGAIAWSYDLLEPGGQRLLDRLSIFASGWDLESAEAICGPASDVGGDILDGLMALVDQSLVKVDTTTTASRASGCSTRSARSPPSGSRRSGELEHGP